ncbi:MAG: hypothetical protein RDU89_06955 [bacterium]|nr:hypothetical protein [bacterium]
MTMLQPALSPTPEQAKAILERARRDPAWWVREVLGVRLWSRQVEILEAVRDHDEAAVASCHGAGKSFVAADVVLWFLCAHRPAIVITTAPTDRQVKGILWKEIRLAHQRATYPLGGRPLTQELRFADDWWAWGFTAPDYDPNRFQGYHEAHVLVVVDEAAGVSEEIYEAIDGILSGEHCRLLMIGNATDPTGRFGRSWRTPGVKTIRISAYDTPNFTTYGITEADIAAGTWEQKITGPLPYPKLVTPAWVAKRYRRWGPTSPMYLARVLGQFPEAGANTLIPLSWVEAAQRRQLEPGNPNVLGVDVARYGDAETVICHRRGPVFRIYLVATRENTVQTSGRVAVALRETGAAQAQVDEVGVGAGVVDNLEAARKPVMGLNAGAAPRDRERFANARAEWYWGLRERFETGDIDLDPADEELAAQLSSLRYRYTARGQIEIESKDEMKKRGLASPDRADAVMLASAEQPVRKGAVPKHPAW